MHKKHRDKVKGLRRVWSLGEKISRSEKEDRDTRCVQEEEFTAREVMQKAQEAAAEKADPMAIKG